MRVMVLGGDGFCGWPTALGLSARGHDVHIIDDFSRRSIDNHLGSSSLTRISTLSERLNAWGEIGKPAISHSTFTVGEDRDLLIAGIEEFSPDTIVHFAEQRSAPYSMKSRAEKEFTIRRNVLSTTDLLNSVVDVRPDAHIVHLGTMGVYGYSQDWGPIPDGYVEVRRTDHNGPSRRIVYPTDPGSVYHLTKSIDHLIFQFYAKNDGLKVTDLHQGVVWGTQTDETKLDPRLSNRFDYDAIYGTVLNRFLVEASIGHPLTVYGTGGQTRAFIHISDTVRCVALAVENPPSSEGQVRIMNQVAETRTVKELAALVSSLTGADTTHIKNPRAEAPENSLDVEFNEFRALGFNPTLLSDELMREVEETVRSNIDRVDLQCIMPKIPWNRRIEGTGLDDGHAADGFGLTS